MLRQNSNIRSVHGSIQYIATYVHAYININETAAYAYVRTYIIYRGEMFMGYSAYQLFYCIPKQSSEPTASYTCNCRNNTIKFIISMYTTGKHRTLTDTQTPHVVDHV